MVFAFIGAALFGIIALLTLLLVFGLPLGEFSMGGQHRIMPPKLRIACVASFFVQLLAIFIILQTARILPVWFPRDVTVGLCFFFAVYLTLNTVMNALSKSRKERFVMTPLSAFTAFCFWFVALTA